MSGAVPKLRFPEFKEKWKSKPLAAMATIRTGARDTQNRVEDGLYPFFVRSDTVERINSFALNCEAVLTSGDGVGVGKNFHYIDGPFDYHQRVYAIFGFQPELNGRYFFQFFKEKFYARVMRMSAKNSVDSVRMSMISEMDVPTPSLSEQKKIAKFLGSVDVKIEGLKEQRANLCTFKAGLMQKLFSQEIRFTRDDGSEFPDWEGKPLDGLVTWQRSNSLSREFASERTGDVQNIHYGDIHGRFPNLFRQSDAGAPFISPSAPIRALREDDFCQVGDIVFADASEDYTDIGKAIEIHEVEPRSLVAGLHTHLARPKVDALALGFSGHVMRADSVRRQIMREAQGVSVLGISKGSLGKVRVPYPHPDEQRKIADALTALDTKIAAVQSQITEMEAFKKGLLQQMFV